MTGFGYLSDTFYKKMRINAFYNIYYKIFKFSYKMAFNSKNPVALILSRQNLKTYHVVSEEEFNKGAYFVRYSKNSKYSIIASGSEVNLALEICDKLKLENIDINVVSMPSWYIFDFLR